MRSFRSKPVGWKGESHRHYLASKGISTKKYSSAKRIPAKVKMCDGGLPVPALVDLEQRKKSLKSPEIRVWFKEEGKDPEYRIFDSFKEAREFARTKKGAENVSLVAYKGWELNLHDIPEAWK